MRIASALCLAAALALLLTPWYEITFLKPSGDGISGYELCRYAWQVRLDSLKPSDIILMALLGLYPFSLFTGIIFSLACRATRWRAAVVGVAAGLGLVALSTLFVHLFLIARDLGQLAFQINVWFYLSHALCLACLILSAIEFRRKPSTG
jgi:hypothetical protein